MKFLVFLIILLLFFSCKNENTKKDFFSIKPPPEKENKSTFNKRIKREVETKLNIPATEKYTLKIQFAHLNSDEKKDAVIAVNRLEFAEQEALNSENSFKRKELGYMGNYNCFFFYEGKSDKISIPLFIASSAKSPLKINIGGIQSTKHNNISVDYRIRNSAFRNYYFIENNSINLVFQWKLFDQIGFDIYEANYIEYEKGSISPAKNILIYKGKIKNYSTKIVDWYSYQPIIEKQKELLYRFFYDPKTMKYVTLK